ncbi:MAG: hypothetical protein IJ278_04280 [Clostridia bacterium]|nr:hypothetical protein [Clostridia bacterium]
MLMQDSWKKSLKMGAVSGAISFGVYALWVVLIGIATGWQSFFGENLSVHRIGFLSWEMAAAAGVIGTSLVPVCTLRYERLKYLLAYIPISLLVYCWLYGAVLAVWITVYPAWCPLANWDSLYYFIIVLPVGSIVGTLVSFVIHFLNKD